MEYERKGVIVNWQIENYKYVGNTLLDSPEISLEVLDGTKWILGLWEISTSGIRLNIERQSRDDGPEVYGLYFEFSANALYGTLSLGTEKKMCENVFCNGDMSSQISLKPDDSQNWKMRAIAISDMITIQCKIWKQKGSISKSCYFSARTRMMTECVEFVGELEKFSDFSEKVKRTSKTVSSSTGKTIMTVNILFRHKLKNKNLKIEIIPLEKYPVVSLKLFILDSSGNKADFGFEYKFELISAKRISLPHISKEYLLGNASLYLPNDILSLHCEITFPSEKYEKVEGIEYETDFASEVKLTDFSNSVEFLNCKEGIVCDTKLRTATETFPANTEILSSKSPVFEAMFKTNMKESIQKCVHIDDVDAETVKRMLVFLYDDTLEELEWKDAMKLYISADKYQILSLQSRCTTLLKKNIDISNCCVLLRLADMYEDTELKEAAKKYISGNRRKVLYCDQWRNLEKNHSQLAIETLRDLYVNHCIDLIIGFE